MPTVGRTLVTERMRQGLELEDIARVTKLSARALQAIEADEFEQLPGTVFARKFVGQYAEALNLDPAAVVRQFDREQSVEGPVFTLPKAHSIPRAPRLSDSRLSAVFESNLLSAFTTFVLTLLVCAAAYYGYGYLRGGGAAARNTRAVTHSVTNAATPPETHAPIPTEAPAKAPEAPLPDARSPIASDVSPLTVPGAVPGAAKVRVALTATGPCWVRIAADGNPVFAGLLAAGESRSVDGDSTVTVRAGDAAALSIKLNGKEISPLGPSGQIRVATLTPSGVQVRKPASEAVADF